MDEAFPHIFSALQTGHFADTFTTYHPGVTTTWLGGTAIWMAYGKDSLSNVSTRSGTFLSPALLARVWLPITYLTGMLIFTIGAIVLFVRWEDSGNWYSILATETFCLLKVGAFILMHLHQNFCF